MAEARGDLNPKAKNDVNEILRRKAGEHLGPLRPIVSFGMKEAMAIAEGMTSLPLKPEDVKKARTLYKRLRKFLKILKITKQPFTENEKDINGVSLGGVGIITGDFVQPEDPSQESKIVIKIEHNKNNEDNAFQTTIALGNKRTAFYEREYTLGSGLAAITKGLWEDAGSPLPDIEKVVAIIENAANKNK